jgi:polyisoprenoid-binding protein YceI
MKYMFFALLSLLFATAATAAEGPCIVPGRSHFQIHVGTGGLFGAFAHNHLIEAQKIEGCSTIDANNLTHSSIKLTFSDLRVMDTKEDAKDRAEVQKTMDTEVLRVSEYPHITFESTAVENSGSGDQLRVRGNLTIRGKTQPIVVPLTFTKQSDGTYHATGKYNFKQTAFGIKPISLGGGTVKVKDELQTDFELFLK